MSSNNRPNSIGTPVRHFTTDTIKPAERHQAWRSQGWPSVAQICDFVADDGFFANTSTIALGPIQMIDGRYGPQQVHRSIAAIRREPVDHLHVTIPTEGDIATDGATIAKDDALVIDLGREWRHRASAGAMTTIVVPRGAAAAAGINLATSHGRTIPAASTVLLREHVGQIFRNHSLIDQRVSGRVANSLLELLSACMSMQDTDAAAPKAKNAVPLKARVEKIIEDNLYKNALSVGLIIRQAKTSRSSLYRLFQDEGGLERAIMARRLAAAKSLVEHTSESMTLISNMLCFSDGAHFARLFRGSYGVTPSDWRRLHARDQDTRPL